MNDAQATIDALIAIAAENGMRWRADMDNEQATPADLLYLVVAECRAAQLDHRHVRGVYNQTQSEYNAATDALTAAVTRVQAAQAALIAVVRRVEG